MLKYSLAGTLLLAIGLSACLEDTTGPQCQPFSNPITGTSGDTVRTEVGLRYIELQQGSSQLEAQWCEAVALEYVGMLTDGTQFDASPPGETLQFVPGAANIIAGVQYGVIGMQVGERRRLLIPANLGYGPQERRDPQTNEVVIPANSNLIFDIELIAVE